MCIPWNFCFFFDKPVYSLGPFPIRVFIISFFVKESLYAKDTDPFSQVSIYFLLVCHLQSFVFGKADY